MSKPGARDHMAEKSLRSPLELALPGSYRCFCCFLGGKEIVPVPKFQGGC
jgi:hypothetical protein